jgi:hypothetical protein
MRAYLIPILTFTIYLGLFFWYRRKLLNRKSVAVWSAASFSIIFACGGFSETLTPVLVAFFLVLLILGLLFREIQPMDQSFNFLLAGYLGALLALIVMVKAPGNSARQALYPQVESIPSIFSIALEGFIEYLREIMDTPEKISGVVGGIIGIAWAGVLDKRGGPTGLLKVFAFIVAGLVFAYLSFLPAAYGISAKPPNRTLIIPTTILIGFFLIAGYFGGKYLAGRIIQRRLVHFVFLIAMTILLVGSATIKASELIKSRYSFIDFARKWDKVDADILRAKQAGDEIIYIPNMDNWAHLDRPTDNPKFWLTACYTKFYGIEIRGPAWEW